MKQFTTPDQFQILNLSLISIGNKNSQKTVGLISKKTTLHV